MYETIKKAGYVKVESIGNKEFILTNNKNKKEIWLANKYRANYGIIYKNTHLEFARSL